MARARSSRSTNELLPLEQLFCEEFMVDMNATRAYLRAGYSASTNESAYVQASKLLKKPHIKRMIKRLTDERLERVSARADKTLAEIALIAHSNVDDYEIGDDGRLSVVPGAPKEALKAVSSLKKTVITKPDGTVIRKYEYRLWSKPQALALEAKHLGLVKDRDVNVQINNVVEMVIVPTKREDDAERLSPVEDRLGIILDGSVKDEPIKDRESIGQPIEPVIIEEIEDERARDASESRESDNHNGSSESDQSSSSDGDSSGSETGS